MITSQRLCYYKRHFTAAFISYGTEKYTKAYIHYISSVYHNDFYTRNSSYFFAKNFMQNHLLSLYNPRVFYPTCRLIMGSDAKLAAFTHTHTHTHTRAHAHTHTHTHDTHIP